jgi:hypothetical protein
MEDGETTQNSSDRLAKALSAILGHGKTISKLSRRLAYGSSKGAVSYHEIKQIIRDDLEEILLMAEEWRLVLPVRTTKSSSWEDRLLLIKDGEVYEVPNVIRYLAKVTRCSSYGNMEFRKGHS